MMDLADVVAESGYADEQVFDLGITGSIVFLVVVPELGACRVPAAALSHFMAGADEYTAEAMPEHYSGTLSGRWTIKRDRLRILPKSWQEWAEITEEIDRLDNLANKAERAQTAAPVTFHLPMFSRLEPRTEWRGSRITHTDILTLQEAAAFATKHAGEEITPGDFVRAAGRGEITLRAFVHRAAQVQKHDGGIYCNRGKENENMVPAGSIATLPLSACQHLANAGRASWRTFDGFKKIDGVLMRYAEAMLADDEADFETVSDDCRVTGYDVHALADAFDVRAPDEPQAATPAPVVAESASSAPFVPRPTATGPKFSMSRAALVNAHAHEWGTIERDLKDASENGLSAAKAGARDWDEAAALEWARSRGKLQPAGSPASDLAQAAHNMASLPSRKHTLKG